jgi:hypothetical protein
VRAVAIVNAEVEVVAGDTRDRGVLAGAVVVAVAEVEIGRAGAR